MFHQPQAKHTVSKLQKHISELTLNISIFITILLNTDSFIMDKLRTYIYGVYFMDALNGTLAAWICVAYSRSAKLF